MKKSIRVFLDGTLYQVLVGKLMASGCGVYDDSACFAPVSESDFDTPEELDEFMHRVKGMVKMEFSINQDPIALESMDAEVRAGFEAKHSQWYFKDHS